MVLLRYIQFSKFTPQSLLVSNYSKKKRKRRNLYLLTEKYSAKTGKLHGEHFNSTLIRAIKEANFKNSFFS